MNAAAFRRILLACGAVLVAAAAPPLSEPEVSDVAVMPAPTPHRLFLMDMLTDTRIIDGDSGQILGGVSTAQSSNVAVSPDQSAIYVAESIWTKHNRGTRQDMISVYDGKTLKLTKEIAIPGRVLMAPKLQLFTLSRSGKTAYVYNMDPSSSVQVVDLEAGKFLRTVEIPGCALIFPFGEDGFSSVCGDGSLATVQLTASGPVLNKGKPFFDADRDPVFEDSAIDETRGVVMFVTYTGLVHEVQLGPSPKFQKPWSLQQAAGFKPPAPDDRELAWRPGGTRPMAWHKASNRLFVLMHPSGHWRQKEAGTEIWIADLAKHEIVKRVPLSEPVASIAVTQDNDARLFAVTKSQKLMVLKASDGEVVKTQDNVGYVVPMVPNG